MKYHTIDNSRFPIVIIRINPISPTDQQFDEYFNEVTQLITQMKKGVIIHILSEAKFLSADKRIKIGNLYKDHGKMLQQNLAGMGYVNSAIIPMTILKGIFLVNKPPVPYTVVSTLDEALKWAEQQTKS